MGHTLIGQKEPSMKRSHGRPYLYITFSWNLQCCIQKLVTKNHTCASRKIAQVRTAAVVSWPAISIVIRSSLSCQESIGRHDFKIIHAKMKREYNWFKTGPTNKWCTYVVHTRIRKKAYSDYLEWGDRKSKYIISKEVKLLVIYLVLEALKEKYLPDGHRHQLPAYQPRNAKGLHPAYFIVKMPESHFFCTILTSKYSSLHFTVI